MLREGGREGGRERESRESGVERKEGEMDKEEEKGHRGGGRGKGWVREGLTLRVLSELPLHNRRLSEDHDTWKHKSL